MEINMFKKTMMFCLFSFSLVFSLNVVAEPIKKGATLPSITLNNQHGKAIKINTDIKTLLFSVEKAPSQIINTFLVKQEANFLTKHKAYFVADISGMPSLISKMFAIPKMKKRPYDILLAKNKAQVDFIPHKKGFISVLKIATGKVLSVRFINNTEQLAKVF